MAIIRTPTSRTGQTPTSTTALKANKNPIITVEPTNASGFDINVPVVINSTCTINGTLKVDEIEDLLEVIKALQNKVAELENRIVALGG
jgi:hypothetical protein